MRLTSLLPPSLLPPILLSMALTALPATAETVSDFTLDNGLQVVVISDHRAPVVTQILYYKVGAADEAPGKSGLAHYLEHLMFKGTETVGPGVFSATVEANGGDDNAFTTADATAYFQRVASDRLEMVMRMEADRMRNLRMTPEDAATELQVILEERSQRTDSDPGALFSEQRQAAQFLNHPYGIPIIGWRHEMEGLTHEDALEFYRTFYAPNNAVLIVAGDATAEEVRRLAETYYGPIAPTPGLGPRVRPAEPPQLAERRIVMEDARVAQPYLMRTYLAPERNPGAQKRAAALVYLAELLGGSGTTSVLARALQFDRQMAVHTGAFYDATSYDPSTFGIYAAPAPGVTLAALEAAMDETIARFLEEGVDMAAFERAKFQMKANEIYARDNADGLARRYGDALTSGLTLEDVRAWPEVLQSVTPEDVMEAARAVFDRRQAVTGWLKAPGGETQ